MLPHELPHRTATRAAALGAALLVHGLATGDGDTLRAALDDVLHVPYRRSLMPGYDEVCGAAVAVGALGATLSGSGLDTLRRRAGAPGPRGRRGDADGLAGSTACRWIFANPAHVEGRNLVVHLDCEDAPATAAAS